MRDYTIIRDDEVRATVCDLMSEMLDNPGSDGIYHTAEFMGKMEDYIIEIKNERDEARRIADEWRNVACGDCYDDRPIEDMLPWEE